MSLWDSVKKFAQPYGDDDYDDYDEDDDYVDDYEEPEERPARRSVGRRAPAAAAVREPEDDGDDSFGFASAAVTASPAAPAPTGTFTGKVHTPSSSLKQEVVLFRPGNFNEASTAADDLVARKAVVLNLENVDKAMSRRVVDFLSGCVYAMDGSVKKIAQSAYLFCPHNMDVVGDLESLQAEVESYI